MDTKEAAAAVPSDREQLEQLLRARITDSERTERELEHAFDDLTDAAQAWVDGESADEDLAKLELAMHSVRARQEQHSAALESVRDASRRVVAHG